MSEKIYDIYADTVKYAQHLEWILKTYTVFDDDDIKHIRSKHIKPVCNVAKEWIEGVNK